ncbi:MAG: winged helix-turn-helix transcriptional regulator [Methanoregula sp.]|nr:winged helix-turn-helix transcriptional regulator [Methanoregula sp.]
MNKLSTMIRQGTWALVLLVFALAASPSSLSSLPGGGPVLPMAGSGHHAGSMPPGCTCGMPVQAAAAMPPANTLPCSGPALPGQPGPVAPGRFSGIRRIGKKNVLDHPERAAVYAMIVASPGIDIAGIGRDLEMNRETLRYHLGQLESAARIVVLRGRGIVRYFENHGRYTLLERKVLRHLWNPTAQEVLSLVAAHPGITQSEIAARLAVSPPTVRWYMQRFCADGIVTGQHAGKYTRYSIVPEAGGIVPGTAQGISPCPGGIGVPGDSPGDKIKEITF